MFGGLTAIIRQLSTQILNGSSHESDVRVKKETGPIPITVINELNALYQKMSHNSAGHLFRGRYVELLNECRTNGYHPTQIKEYWDKLRHLDFQTRQ